MEVGERARIGLQEGQEAQVLHGGDKTQSFCNRLWIWEPPAGPGIATRVYSNPSFGTDLPMTRAGP